MALTPLINTPSARVGQRPGGGEERADGRVDAAACAAGRRGGLAAAGGYRLAVGDAERARQREPPRSGALPGRPRAAAGQIPPLRAPARDGAPAGVPGPGCSARAADRPSGRECHHPCNGPRRTTGPGAGHRLRHTAAWGSAGGGFAGAGKLLRHTSRRRPLSTPGPTSPRSYHRSATAMASLAAESEAGPLPMQ